MAIKRAIEQLREKMGVSQQELADRVGVTVTSISRYENGREPARPVLKKLAEVAGSAKLSQLRKVFEESWQAAIARRIETLPSAGTQRGVSIHDLEHWQRMARETANMLAIVLPTAPDSPGKEVLEILQYDQKRIAEEIGVYIHGTKGGKGK